MKRLLSLIFIFVLCCTSSVQAGVLIAKGSLGNKSLTAKWEPAITIPSADAYTKTENIISFINANRNTTQQICFQAGWDGKFYVGAGENFIQGKDPDIDSNGGTLIYDAGSSRPTKKGAENYKYAAHLANIANFILHETLGSDFGSSTPLFPDKYEKYELSRYSTNVSLSRGYTVVYGDEYIFDVLPSGATGYHFNGSLTSDGSDASWFGKTDNQDVDEYTKTDNIDSFINTNKNTSLQICFQCDVNGKFYVKTGIFTQNTNPDIISSGILIYDAGSSAPSTSEATNYKHAAHIANIMNHILYETKGSEYGSSTDLFTDSYTSGNYYTDLGSSLSKGFYKAIGYSDSFGCSARGYTGYYGGIHVFSVDDGAVWFGEPVTIPGTDSFTKTANITSFINTNIGTPQQICFQGDSNGKFYVKAGSFTKYSNPNLASNGGTLIYDAGSDRPSSDSATQYKYGAHLMNIMNYILYCTKGSKYGSSTALFTDTPETAYDGGYYTSLDYSPSKGFYNACGFRLYFGGIARLPVGYYDNTGVSSHMTDAVWW